MIEMLRRAASDRSLSIGEAWHLLDAAADEIERLQADAHALAAERLCRAVEVAVLLEIVWAVAEAYKAAPKLGPAGYHWADVQLDHEVGQDAVAIIESTRAPVARKGGK